MIYSMKSDYFSLSIKGLNQTLVFHKVKILQILTKMSFINPTEQIIWIFAKPLVTYVDVITFRTKYLYICTVSSNSIESICIEYFQIQSQLYFLVPYWWCIDHLQVYYSGQ